MNNFHQVDDDIIIVIAHLYDRYGTYLIGATTVSEAKKYSYNLSISFKQWESAERFVKIRLDNIEKFSKASYDVGQRYLLKASRKKYDYFLENVFKESLIKMGYDGWIESA